jgi:CheY-like chemotaxis protein
MAKARKRRRQSIRRRAGAPRRAAAAKVRSLEALASLAHEIRTPLTGILALAELLQAGDLPDRERRWAESIRSTAEHMAQLTGVVVDAAKADTGGLILRSEVFAPHDLAQAVAGSLTARAEAKGLQAETDIASNLPAGVSGDSLRLRGALENLIDNAVKFTERGRIAFSAAAKRAGRGRTRLVFTVKDGGIGMTPAELKRLFRPFSQASAKVARRYGGSGLGLVFVKRIAEAMGGKLDVTSRPGRGSTFRLSVVMQDRGPAQPKREPAAATGLRVLCVEDNPYGRIVLATVLRELGHRTTFAGTADAAIEALTRHDFDAVLMDVALPGMSGIEATQRVRALPAPKGKVPIVGISGRTEPGDEATARAAGMNGYLRKPVSLTELDRALQSLAGDAGNA